MAVTFRKPVDDNVPYDQRLANYASNPNAGRDEYKRALEVYRGKSALGDTQGATAAKTWSDQVNTAIGGVGNQPNDEVKQALTAYKAKISQPVTPFRYDANNDPSFQAQKANIALDTQRDMNNARVDAGAVGMRGGSLQNNQLMQLSARNESRLQNEILPNAMAVAYQQYRDKQNQDQLQNQNELGYINSLADLNQKDFNNNRLTQADQYLAEDRGMNQQDRRIKLAADLEARYGRQVNPTNDYSQALAQVAGLKPIAQQNQETAAQKAVQESAIKQFNDIGFATPEIAKVLGIPEGTTTQQAKYQQGQLGIQQQQASNSAASTANSAGNASASRDLAERRFQFEKDQASGKSKSKEISQTSYSEFLQDLPRVQSQEEGYQLIQMYRQDGVDEATLATMSKAINSKFKE